MKEKKIKRIKFLTDSAADIPAKYCKDLDIMVMPFPIIAGDKEYKDGVDFTPQKFYDFLLKQEQIPSHSQFTPYQFTEVYENIWAEGYSNLIYTAINAKGSATYNNALLAREEFYEEHPEAKEDFTIYIVDSRTYTMAYGWGVVQAAQMASCGAGAEICVAAIQDWCDNVRVLFTPMDLSFAKKSGRISAAAAFLGEKLGLHPIMTFEDGESKSLSKIRGDKNVIPMMLSMMQKNREEGSPYLLIYAQNKEMNKALSKTFTEELQEKPAAEYYIGGVISINAGPNLIGVIYREKKSK